jgi:hypothetical protein
MFFVGLTVIELRLRAPPRSSAELFPMIKNETKSSSGELLLDYGSAFCELSDALSR